MATTVAISRGNGVAGMSVSPDANVDDMSGGVVETVGGTGLAPFVHGKMTIENEISIPIDCMVS